MAYEFFANNAVSTLAVTISDSSTEIQPADPSTFPAQSRFRIRIGSELMLVTAVVVIDGTLTKWYVDRGIEGTAPATHNSGTTIRVVVTAEALEALNGMPMGGATGQFLSKAGSDDYDTQWADIDLAGGGFTGVLPVANGGTGASTFTSQSLVVASSGVLTSAGQTVYASSGTILTLAAGSAGDKPLVLKGASGQTGNLLELQDSGGSRITGFSADGKLLAPTGAINMGRANGDAWGGCYQQMWGHSTTQPREMFLINTYWLDVNDATRHSKIDFIGYNIYGQTNIAQFDIAYNEGCSPTFFIGNSGIGKMQLASNSSFVVTDSNVELIHAFSNFVTDDYSVSIGSRTTIQSHLSTETACTIKGVASQVANLQEWQNSSETTLAALTSDGFLAVTRGTSGLPFSAAAPIHVMAPSGYNADFRVQGQGSTTNVFDVFAGNDGSNPACGFYAYGSLHFVLGTNGTTRAVLNNNGDFALGGSYSDLYATPSAKLHVRTGAAGKVGEVVQASGSQTANLQEWQDSGGTIQSSVNKDGFMMTRKVSAPADGDLADSELSYWFDDSPGKAKIKFKGKDSEGNIVNGEVELS